MKQTFENYLWSIFSSERPEVLDDDLTEEFDKWVEQFDANDILQMVKEYEGINF